METIRGRFKGYHEIYKNNSQYADLAYYFFEKLHIGYSYSHTLKQIFLKSEPTLVNVSEVKLLEDDDKIKLVGIVDSCYLRKSKAGNRYLQVRLTDETGDLDCKLFKDRIEVCKEENGGNLPAEGEVVFVTGTKKQGNTVFLDSLAVQRHKIFTKLSELPEIPLEKIE
jgi:DNA polymerase III alpha subunit